MPFWSGETIQGRVVAQSIIEPFDRNRIDCAAYTLRIGSEYFVTPDSNAINLSTHTKVQLDPIGANGFGGAFQIPAGQFAFLLTEEYLQIPKDVVAFISLKTHLKWRGLINVSGFHLDGGFEGYFIFSVYNAGPRAIHLQRGQPLFLMWFADLDNKQTEFYRKNKPPQRNIDPKYVTDIASPILSTQGLTEEVRRLATKIERITLYSAILGFVAGAAIAIAGLLIEHWSAFMGFLNTIAGSGPAAP